MPRHASAFGFFRRGLFPLGRSGGFTLSRFHLGYGNLHEGYYRYADIARIEHLNTFRNLEILNLDRSADLQTAHIDIDEIGHSRRQARDLYIPFEMLELPAVFNSDWSAYKTERDIDRQFMVHPDFIKIGMVEASADRFDLQLLDHGELFQTLLAFDEQFDEDVFFPGLYDLRKIGHIHR